MVSTCREFFRWISITVIVASFVKVHFFMFNMVNLFRPFDKATSSSQDNAAAARGVVHYGNLTTPKFIIDIRYTWETASPNVRPSSPNLRNRNNSTTTTNSSKSSNESNSTVPAAAEKQDQEDDDSSKEAVIEMRPYLAWNLETKQQLLVEASDDNDNFDDSQRKFVMVGDVLGTFHDRRLSVEVDETYAFWNNGQSKLCQLLRDMTLKPSLDDETPTTLGANMSVLPRPLLNMTMNCEQVTTREDFGQGNWITALYCVRMAAAVAKVDYQFQCSSGRESQMTALLPWFDGYHPAPTEEDPWPYDGEQPTESEVCFDKYRGIRVDKMSHEIQKDIRKIAVELVGPHSWNASSDSTDIQTLDDHNDQPLIANVTLDEVAIHFRCGDVMGGARRHDFGMIKFNEYPKWIRNETQSIGILTQPFDKSMTRGRDKGKTEACRDAVYLLVDYLQKRYPKAVIHIRNSPEETLPLAFARIAMAKQSFTTLSSFGIFPVMGTFGEGYFQKGNPGVNPFAKWIPRYLTNQHQMTAPVKSSAQIHEMGLNQTLAWFVSEDRDE